MSTGGDGGDFNVGGVSGSVDVDLSGVGVGLQALKRQLQAVEAEIGDMEAAFKAGAYKSAADLDQALGKLEQLRQVQGQLNQQIAGMGTASRGAATAASQTTGSMATGTTQIQAGMAGVAMQTNNAAMKMLLLGQFMDDAQYGLRSVVNNIPQLAMAFGLPTQLAGAIGIATVALNQFSQHWDQVKETFGDTGPFKAVEDALSGIKSAMKPSGEEGTFLSILKGLGGGLADKITGGETPAEKVARVEKELRAREAKSLGDVTGIQNAEAAARGEGVRKAIGQFEGGGKRLIESLTKNAFETDPHYKLTPGMDDAARAKIEAARKRLQGQVADAIADALKGDEGAIKRLMGMRGAPGLAPLIEANRPGVVAQQKKDEEEVAEDRRRGEAHAEDMRREREKQLDAMTKGLGASILGRKALGGDLQVADVREALARAGYDERTTTIEGPEITRRLRAEAADRVRQRAEQSGKTPEEARADLEREQSDRERAAARQRAQAAAGRARELIPGLDEDLNAALMHTPGRADVADEAMTARLKRRLAEAGLSDQEAALAAPELVNRQRRGINERLADLTRNGGQGLMDLIEDAQGPKRSSQVMDPLSLVKAIQGGVGPDLSRQQLQKLDRLVTIQAQLLNLQRNQRRGVFLPAQ